MGTSNLKSAAITTLDGGAANPPAPTQLQAGAGAPSRAKLVDGFVTTVSADAAASTYKLVRFPSNATIKHVRLAWAAMTAGKVQLSVYYSDSTQDGTPPANQGVIVPTTGAAFFSDDIDLTSASGWVDKTFANGATGGANNVGLVDKRIWDALGLTSDPGGFFDLVAVVHTTAITTGALLGAEVEYVD